MDKNSEKMLMSSKGIKSLCIMASLFVLVAIIILVFSKSIPNMFFYLSFFYLLFSAIATYGTAYLMHRSRTKGKPQLLQTLVEGMNLSGHEQVLDIGSSLSPMTREVSKKLQSGAILGVDLNSGPIPYPDHHFDFILFYPANPHVSSLEEREKAALEMARVLKPGGTMHILGFRESRAYSDLFKALGCEVTLSPRNYNVFPPIRILTVRKTL